MMTVASMFFFLINHYRVVSLRIMFRGRVAIGDSHFINQQLGRRLLGAYYLGCPMTPAVLHAYSEIVNTIRYNEVGEGVGYEGDEGVVHVTKVVHSHGYYPIIH